MKCLFAIFESVDFRAHEAGDLQGVLVTSPMPAVRALISQRFREILIIIHNFYLALFSGVPKLTRAVLVTSLKPAAGALISQRFRRWEILREPL